MGRDTARGTTQLDYKHSPPHTTNGWMPGWLGTIVFNQHSQVAFITCLLPVSSTPGSLGTYRRLLFLIIVFKLDQIFTYNITD